MKPQNATASARVGGLAAPAADAPDRATGRASGCRIGPVVYGPSAPLRGRAASQLPVTAAVICAWAMHNANLSSFSNSYIQNLAADTLQGTL